MLKEVRLPYTQFKDLRDGDEFIRVSGLPVLLRDVRGSRRGNSFTPEGWVTGRKFDIRVMRMMPRGWLKEVNLNEGDAEDNPIEPKGGPITAADRGA